MNDKKFELVDRLLSEACSALEKDVDTYNERALTEGVDMATLVGAVAVAAIIGALLIAECALEYSSRIKEYAKQSKAVNFNEFKDAINILKDECVDWSKDSKFSKFVKSGAMRFNSDIMVKYSTAVGRMVPVEIRKSTPFWVYAPIASINVKQYVEDLGLVQKYNINYMAAKEELEKIIKDLSDYLLNRWKPIAAKSQILKNCFTPMVIPSNGNLYIVIATTGSLILDESKYLE